MIRIQAEDYAHADSVARDYMRDGWRMQFQDGHTIALEYRDTVNIYGEFTPPDDTMYIHWS